MMRFRSILICVFALAALAGGVISALAFLTFEESNLPVAWLFNCSALVLVFALGFSVSGGRHSIAILLCILAACLPAVGPVIAALVALSIHFMRPAKEDDELYKVGNPLTSNTTGKPETVLGRPLVEAVRRLDDKNLFRLLSGIGSLAPKDSRPIQFRLRDSENAQIQLVAQGGLNDAIESAERHLRSLNRRARQHPKEAQTHCTIAEINLHLLEHHLVEEDDRPSTWNAASEAVGKALKIKPQDVVSLQVCARLNLLGGDTEKARLAATALRKIPGQAEVANMILAEVAFESGDFEAVKLKLEDVRQGNPDHGPVLDFWNKPRPTAYA